MGKHLLTREDGGVRVKAGKRDGVSELCTVEDASCKGRAELTYVSFAQLGFSKSRPHREASGMASFPNNPT